MKDEVITRATGSIRFVRRENGVEGVTEQYYLSVSPYVLSGGTWLDASPVQKTGYYLWTRLVTRYTDGTATVSDAVCRSFTDNINANILRQALFAGEEKMDRWQFNNKGDSHINALCVDGRNGYQLVASATDASAITILSQSLGGKLSPSTWYTLSFWAKSSGLFEAVILNGKTPSETFYVNGKETANGGTGASAYFTANGWEATFYAITFKTPALLTGNERLSFAAYPKGYVYGGSAITRNTEAAIVMPKLERGMAATAFSVNEEDLVGDQGVPGIGTDGKTSYFHVKYSSVANPVDSQMTETPSEYIGTCVDFNKEDPTNATAYTWARFQGMQGPQGIPGVGKDGKTMFLHIKYSDDGGKTFTADSGETAGKWMGVYSDFSIDDSTDVKDYTWSRIQGEQGADGKDAYLLDLDNENASVTCDADGNVIGNIPGANIYLYKGPRLVTDTQNMKVTAVFSGCTGNVTAEEVDMATLDDDHGEVAITCVYEGVTMTALFTLTKVYNGRDGSDATIDYLTTDVSVIRYTKDGTMSPTSITATHMRRQGTNAPSQGNGQKVELTAYTSSGAKRATISTTSGKATMSNIAITTAYIIANLYGPTGTIIDTERIPVVSDGQQGDPGEPGAPGAPGSDGEDGEDGNGIVSQTSYFAATDKPRVTRASDITTWGSTFPSATVEKPYVWKYVHTVYSKATATDSVPELIATFQAGAGANLLDCTSFIAANRMASWSVMSVYSMITGPAPSDKGKIDGSTQCLGRNSYHDTMTADPDSASHKTMLSQTVNDTTAQTAKLEASKWYTLSFWLKGKPTFEIKLWTASWGFKEVHVHLEAGVRYVFGATGRINATASAMGQYLQVTLQKTDWTQQTNLKITSTYNTTQTAVYIPAVTGEYYMTTYASMKGDTSLGQAWIEGYILHREDYADDDVRAVIGSGLRSAADKVYVDGVEKTLSSGAELSFGFTARKDAFERHTITFRTATYIYGTQSVDFRMQPAPNGSQLEAWLAMPKLEAGMFATDYTEGPNDSRGDSGAQIRQHKDGFVSGSYTYMSGGNGEPYVDFVYLKTAKLWYRCIKTEMTDSPSVSDGCWEAVGQTWEVVATGLLLADNASIDFLQTNAINIYDPTTMNGSDPKVQASIRGVSSATDYPLFVGSDVAGRTSAPFRVNLRGEVWMENAHIGGEVQAKTGTIGGYNITESSLYARVSSSDDDELHMELTPQRIRFSSQYVTCGFGNNTTDPATGVTSSPLLTTVRRNFASSSAAQINVCHVVSAEGTITARDETAFPNGNHAVMAMKGDYAGFRMMTRRVRASRALDNYEGIILCMNTTDITLTLPTDAEDGKMYFVRKCAGGNITVSGRIRRNFNSIGSDTVIKNNSLCILLYDAVNNWWTANIIKDEAD